MKDQKVAVVTGGSRGIGKAIVEALAEDGYRVVFASRNPDSVRRAEEELDQRFPGQVKGFAVDVRRQEEVDAFIAGVDREHGRIDCLVNNAGLGHFAPVDQITGEQWREVLETNLDGAFYCTRAVTPVMKRLAEGWILNIASLAGKNPFAGGAAYNASKFGMVGFSEASMLDLRQHGIRVAAILPGSVDTDFHSRPETGWMIRPEDIAQAVMDLLRYPARTLPSRVEIRPTHPPGK